MENGHRNFMGKIVQTIWEPCLWPVHSPRMALQEGAPVYIGRPCISRLSTIDSLKICNIICIFPCFFQFSDWIESHFLTEQVEAIKELSDHVTNLKRVGSGLGEYMYDKETLSD